MRALMPDAMVGIGLVWGNNAVAKDNATARESR
jgi:hypothetical protein